VGRLFEKVQRVRHAGLANATRAVASRMRKRLAATRIGRGLMKTPGEVSREELLAAIDFGEAPAGDLKACFIDCNPARHILEDAGSTAELARRVFPDAVEQTLTAANAVCRHEFHFLGRDARFGETVDWQWCPEGGGAWPLCPASDFLGKHSYFKEDRIGDVKYPWELHRHQFFVTLGKAYHYTGDERYARECTDLFLHWLEANPYDKGLGWYGSMEFGIRLISWANAFWLLKDSPYFQQNGLEPMLRATYQLARRLEAFLTTDWLVPTNHLIGETAGLFTCGVLFPAFRDAARWRRKGLAIFAREMVDQTYADGVNKEQSPGYHRFIVDFGLLVFRLCTLNGIAAPRPFVQRLERLLEYEQAVGPPDNNMPMLGDCDDGRGYILSESVPFGDFRGWLAAGAVLYGRPDFKSAAPEGNDEALWFLGPELWRAFESMDPPEPARASTLFRDGGQALLRTADSPAATTVLVRCGDFGLGLDGACGHSHADILAPVIHWRGQPLAVDAGTYAYYCSREERDRFRSTAAHNTMAPRGREQGRLGSISSWAAVPRTHVTEWVVDNAHTRLKAECVSPCGYRHRRALALDHASHTLVFEDDLVLEASSAAPIDWYLHFAPGLDIAQQDPHRFIVRKGDTPILTVSLEGFDTAAVRDSWHSPSYGVKVANRCLCATVTGKDVTTKATLSDA